MTAKAEEENKMKESTIKRITNSGKNGTIIGRYTYRYNVWTGEISRCLTDNVDLQFIDCDGNITNAWSVVARNVYHD